MKNERIFDADCMIEFDQFVTLASRLPTAADAPRTIHCERCGASLGAVGNSAGVVTGSFLPDVVMSESGTVAYGSKLTGVSVVSHRRVELKCKCGYVKIWHCR